MGMYDDNSKLFTEEQLNISNWTKNNAGWQTFQNSYENGINTLRYKGGDLYERIFTKIQVERNTQYEIHIKCNSPTGFSIGGYSGIYTEQFIITSSNPSDRNIPYKNLGNIIALSDNIDNSASNVPKDYAISFNSGNYTELYVVIDFGQLEDGKDVTFVFEIPINHFTTKYLIRDQNILYTVTDNQLVEISGTLDANLFLDKGFDTTPDSSLLITLNSPEVLCWTDDENVPVINADVIAVPKTQKLISNAIDLTHDSIKGIEKVTVTCENELIVAVSFDEKQTWKVFNNNQWVTVSNEYAGMSKDAIESITIDQWNELYLGATSFYIRVIFENTQQTLTSIHVDFVN